MTVVFEEIGAGKAFVEGTADGDLIAMLKALSDVTAALMDSAGLSVASAIYSESVGMFIASMHSVNELNRKGDEASAVFEDNTRRIIESFDRIADAAGSALMSARLAPYLRPKYLINITLPDTATVGQPASVLIDQRLAQPIAYRVTWGSYPNGNAVTDSPSAWRSSGGTTALSATYTMPGSYPVAVELYDNSLGVALVAFQVLGKQLVVNCPNGTTVDPGGDCVSLPPVDSQVVVVPAADFVRGENVALSAEGYGADTLMNAPPYLAAANAAEWDFTVATAGTYELFAELRRRGKSARCHLVQWRGEVQQCLVGHHGRMVPGKPAGHIAGLGSTGGGFDHHAGGQERCLSAHQGVQAGLAPAELRLDPRMPFKS